MGAKTTTKTAAASTDNRYFIDTRPIGIGLIVAQAGEVLAISEGDPARAAAAVGERASSPGAPAVQPRRDWAVAAGSVARSGESPGASAGAEEDEVAAADSAAPAASAAALGAACAGVAADASSSRAGQTRDDRGNSGPNNRRD